MTKLKLKIGLFISYLFTLNSAVYAQAVPEANISLPNSPGTLWMKFTSEGLIGQLVSAILPIILVIAGFLTVIFIILSGIQFVTSGGNPEAANGARARLTYAIVGFVIIVLAFSLVKIIDTIFLGNSGVI